MWIQMEISVWEDYLYPTQHLVFNVFNTPSFHSLKFAILSKVVIIYVGLQHDGRLVREALQGRFMKLQGLPYLLVFFRGCPPMKHVEKCLEEPTMLIVTNECKKSHPKLPSYQHNLQMMPPK
ncbi:hypothetical protein TSUD_252570 [Trifolium subterraneum]|nr:hypothetical protein TSUD_252570 [Trifolium subterraneum]